jgi:hypothetical protein
MWCNNGYRNIIVSSEANIPEGYKKGYVLRGDKKIARIKKLNKQYDDRIDQLKKHYEELFEKKKEKLLDELKERQHKIMAF